MFVDAEGEAGAIRSAAGVDRDDVVSVLDLAKKLSVGVAFYPQNLLRGLDARVFWPRGRGHPPEIALRRGLTLRRRAWCIAHELAELQLARSQYDRGDVEIVANAAAAALIMPRGPFRAAVQEHGFSLPELAADFACEETAAALRLGEVGVVAAVAVICPTRVHVRASNDEFVFPSEKELRRLARLAGPSGVVAHRLQVGDRPRRVALLLEAA